MSPDIVIALDDFVQNYLSQEPSNPEAMIVKYDPEWPSACYQNQGEIGQDVKWKPVLRSELADFSGLESALDLTLHDDIKAFYSRYWSENLSAKTEKGCLQLLQAWNLEDFERLQQNLIGHILMKRRLNQPETIFFGLTDQDDFILTIDNSSGQVMLEQVGLHPTEVLAPTLTEFIARLEPDLSLTYL
ncbi:SecY-interacting protein [Paraglaciecola sp.]|uniref:SecY-interacting protein n=1 Tax=Paraglaciecola sp. TaxID=1920173 RepID=UPI003EFB0698